MSSPRRPRPFRRSEAPRTRSSEPPDLEASSAEVWLARACDGDERALAWLHGRYADQLRGYVRTHSFPSTRRWVDGDEIVNVAFHEVFQGLSRSSVATGTEFLRRLKRVALQRLRDVSRRSSRLSGESEGGARIDPAAEASQLGPVTKADEVSVLVRFIDALPEPYREVLHLSVREGLDHAVIAERLGLTADAVYRRHRRALDQLRRRLEARDGA